MAYDNRPIQAGYIGSAIKGPADPQPNLLHDICEKLRGTKGSLQSTTNVLMTTADRILGTIPEVNQQETAEVPSQNAIDSLLYEINQLKNLARELESVTERLSRL